jgi:hypothetical protein
MNRGAAVAGSSRERCGADLDDAKALGDHDLFWSIP